MSACTTGKEDLRCRRSTRSTTSSSDGPKRGGRSTKPGGGEAEGFEQAEQELIEHASHGDEHNTTPIFRDAEGVTEEEGAVGDSTYGEADEEQKPDQ